MHSRILTFVGALLLLITGISHASSPEPVTSSPKPQTDNVVVDINTSQGTITLNLDKKHSPETVRNFLQYANEGFYDGTIFHRVIANFMIQGGGMTPDMDRKQTHQPIRNESGNGLTNRRGTIAMARTNNPDSATSQFFINLVDNNYLDGSQSQPGYTVFGEVIDGMNVVEKIGKTRTTRKGPHADVPSETITITSVTVRQ
ncbi:peptidylprolyl isomerase [Kistimonas scapharcae]|uniref:Peptidyl-prolyl cis-trans isomerase n=1 Tax=Kistimonas scapharcae TaxID=1036133 RepID=A0ABP8V2A5_9GAMM